MPPAAAVKTRQQATWASGDYAVVGTTLQIVGEQLCEAMDLRAGSRVLDVAAGNGNATLAAARRWAEVVSTDYAPALLERARARAQAERLQGIEFREADAEALPFGEAAFDAVLSTLGCMFAPNPRRVAAELLRVCKPGGRIGLANWTPQGFIGQLFKTISQHVSPPAGIESPALWGSRERIEELFGAGTRAREALRRRATVAAAREPHMRIVAIAASMVTLLGGCAPDAVDNLKATGFDGFLNRVSVECAPLVVGSQVVTANYAAPDYALDLYDQWFDATSRLYYKRIAPEAYLNEIYNYFGDARTQASARCLVSKLPPAEQRPSAPTGRW